MAKRTNWVAWGLAVLEMYLWPTQAICQSELQRPGEAKAVTNASDRFERTPLMLAAVKGDADRVRDLLSQGADINARDKNGMTALMWSAPSVSLPLLQNGADPKLCDRFGRSPMHSAALSGDILLITALLKRGLAVEAKDKRGWTPLHHTVHWGTLLALTWTLSEEEETAIALQEKRSRQSSPEEVIRTLLDNGAGVDTPDPTERTPLILTMGPLRATNSPVVRLLLSRGANVNAKTMHGGTALLLQAWCGNSATVKWLLDLGADVNAEDATGFTALTFAAQKGDYRMAKLLLERGANVNGGKERGPFGERRTPLMAAADHNPQIVKLLLQKGAAIGARDAHGRTAFDWAEDAGAPAERVVRRAIREMLKKAGAKE